jgi:UDP-N-acetylglucosamine--N-acetylmuramyl-(pentapeptide) pyrophosphoryl-undecaprenol N-acetylglucosamine transferase
MVLVPLPTSAGDHQRYNARALAEAGAALVLEQGPDLGPRLGATVSALAQDPARLGAMSKAALERGRPGAVDEIVTKFLSLSGG